MGPSQLLELSAGDVTSLAASKLYLPAGHFTLDSVRLTILNFRLFGTLVTPDFDKSLLWQILTRLELLLFQQEGQAFHQQYQQKPEVAVNVLMDVHLIVAKFFAIGRDMTAVDGILAGNTVDLSAFDSIYPLADTIVGNLAGVIGMSRPTDTYAMIPQALFEVMKIKPKKEDKPVPAGKDKRTPDQSGGGTPAKTPKKDKQGSPGSDSTPKVKTPASELGFLEYIGDKPPTPANLGFAIAHVSKKDTQEHPCPNFVFKGYTCPHKNCTLLHTPWRKLKDEDKEKFKTYVEGNKEAVRFVKGSGPPGTQ